MKYQIMWEWDTRKFGFETGSDSKEVMNFDTIGEALDFATTRGYSTNFIIVSKVDYKKLTLQS